MNVGEHAIFGCYKRRKTYPNKVNPVPATHAIAAVNAVPLRRGAAAATSASNSDESTATVASFFDFREVVEAPSSET